MATPVGPAPRDPHDPDMWDEWYERDADGCDIDDRAPRQFGWPVRLVALLVVLAIASLLVFAL